MNTSRSPADPRHVIARRAAREVSRGQIINLGIGLPTLIPHYVDAASGVWIHSENGILGVGPSGDDDALDSELIDAGAGTCRSCPAGRWSIARCRSA
ncbi:CoA-transferase [Verminephrobacter aporrectodeae]|uniref:CoA-transferase n=1 Tax=Verminephrobacter aporrectodeae TaxID=1110389 RepID=UPI00031AFE95|nr:CoA-transferase [Verminephrobacter aporrectodeae]